MNRKDIRHTILFYCKKLKKYSNKVADGPNAEMIHCFRVSYKKLRAFLRMLNSRKKGAEKLKLTRMLKSCYHVAGTIRDIQLQQRIKLPAAYQILLKRKVAALTPLLVKHVALKPVAKTKKKILGGMPHSVSLKDLNQYSRKKWKEVNSIINTAQFDDTSIHTLRKCLKDISYNQALFKKDEKKSVQLPDDLLDELGKFQDKNVALSFLTDDWMQKISPACREKLQRTKTQLKSEKERIKKKLVNALTSLTGLNLQALLYF